jgi:hypothetical protein
MVECARRFTARPALMSGRYVCTGAEQNAVATHTPLSLTDKQNTTLIMGPAYGTWPMNLHALSNVSSGLLRTSTISCGFCHVFIAFLHDVLKAAPIHVRAWYISHAALSNVIRRAAFVYGRADGSPHRQIGDLAFG